MIPLSANLRIHKLDPSLKAGIASISTVILGNHKEQHRSSAYHRESKSADGTHNSYIQRKIQSVTNAH